MTGRQNPRILVRSAVFPSTLLASTALALVLASVPDRAEAGCYKVQERTITKTYNVYHDGG